MCICVYVREKLTSNPSFLGLYIGQGFRVWEVAAFILAVEAGRLDREGS